VNYQQKILRFNCDFHEQIGPSNDLGNHLAQGARHRFNEYLSDCITCGYEVIRFVSTASPLRDSQDTRVRCRRVADPNNMPVLCARRRNARAASRQEAYFAPSWSRDVQLGRENGWPASRDQLARQEMARDWPGLEQFDWCREPR
jgi:hypothetical protein